MAAQRRCFLEVAFLAALAAAASIQASTSWHMTDFIKSLEEVESRNPGLEPVALLRALRQSAGLNDPYTQHFLGTDNATMPAIDVALSVYFATALIHSVKADGTEEGVLLTPDGTTVALAPVLLGLEAAFRLASRGRALSIYQLTLGRDLGQLFASGPAPLRLQAPDGCWDSPASPRVFRLAGAGSPVTTALVNGGMDGVLLGLKASAARSRGRVSASGLLRGYYGGGDGGGARLRGARRRENFRALAGPPLLVGLALRSIELQRRLKGEARMEDEEKQMLMTLLNNGMKEFALKFTECPTIIPRCMWRAKPYKGTPTLLSPPLTHVYIHHTELPSAPCQTFEQCSAVMRSIQRYHQEERGWDDIGYSFAVGSDGYIYEGRGWRWRGAHTLGHNAKSYGVAFIGDYSSRLPSDESLELVRDSLAGCAVARGLLVADYAVQGHRQAVATTCPGDALYHQIREWGHWKPTKDKVAGN